MTQEFTNRAAERSQEIMKIVKGWKQALKHCEIKIKMLERYLLPEFNRPETYEIIEAELMALREIQRLLLGESL